MKHRLVKVGQLMDSGYLFYEYIKEIMLKT
jgi:hypothetical protein